MRYRSIWYSGLLVAALLCFFVPVDHAGARERRSNADYVPDEILVKLKPSTDVREFARSAGLRAGPKSIEQLGSHAIYRLQIADGTSPPRKAARLESDWRVLYAEPDYLGELPEARQRSSWAIGGDTYEYTAQWAPAKMRLTEAHAVTRGAGVTVAILDTGVDRTHPALAGRLAGGYDFVDLDDDPSEQRAYDEDEQSAFGHGTHVAGLVALAAPDVLIMPLRTLNPDGIGTIWAQAQALRYAVEHGADVVNLSYSFSRPSKLLDDILAELTCAAPIDEDCRAKERPGVVVVAAAGNSGVRVREYPAADPLPGVLAVGASTDTDTLAAFSTYGAWVQVAAPGDHILSTIPGGGYATWSGTSMAAPLTAGTIALLRAARPGLRPADTVARIMTTSAPIHSLVRRRVDAAAALGIAPLNPSD